MFHLVSSFKNFYFFLSAHRMHFARNLFSMLSFLLSLVSAKSLFGDCRGKIDVAPAFVHLDVINFGKTIKTMDMPGIKADANYLIYKGICIKPGLLYANNRGSLLTTGAGLGIALPYKRWCVTPAIGANYTQVRTSIPIDLGDFKLKAREKFRSWSPYASIEVFYRIAKRWRIGAQFQYAWSRSHTTIEGFGSDKSNAKGPSYSILLERDFCDHWSLNFGAAYNLSLTKEKHGIRGYGFKLGLARWF